jgi:phosphinothricin acetyltransferase
VVIRDARADDAAAMLDIYRPFVTDTAVSFELEPPTIDQFAERVAKAQSEWAWLVADADGAIAGYAYAGAFRTRAAYRWTAETSAYVGATHRGRGVGASLYHALLRALTDRGFCNAYAGIALPNEASIALHRSVGFQPVGVFERAGWKFNRWHDVSWWQLRLADAPGAGADRTAAALAANGRTDRRSDGG